MTNTMTVAEGLSEIKRIVKLLPKRNANILQYCSKRKGSDDLIEKQQDYVKEQRKSAEDLINQMEDIKEAIMRSNLDTTITWKDRTMSVARAIRFKSNVRGRLVNTKSLFEALYSSFNTYSADDQIETYARIQGYQQNRMPEGDPEKLNLVPELYYDVREVQGKIESLIEFESMLDALIDASNHKTQITI